MQVGEEVYLYHIGSILDIDYILPFYISLFVLVAVAIDSALIFLNVGPTPHGGPDGHCQPYQHRQWSRGLDRH